MARRRKPSDVNILLAVDKPLGLSSHDAVNRVRRQLDERRVGHAGTLDPLATGVLVVGVGQATRLLGRLALHRKRYLARIAFGTETLTDDAEGEVVRRVPAAPELADERVARRVLAGFLGPQEQVPPAFSAISVDGVRSYQRARAGEEVVLEARKIEVFGAELVALEQTCEGPVWTVSFEVSKGTYIRTLARDIGRAAQSAAHLDGLTRTAVGDIGLGSCLALDGLDREAALGAALDPVRALGLRAFDIAEGALDGVLCGRALRFCDAVPRDGVALPSEGVDAALVHAGELRAIAVVEGGRLRMSDVFPQGIGGVR